MDGLAKRDPKILALTKRKNMTLKIFGVATVLLGTYVIYLGSKDPSFIDAEFEVVN